MATATEGASVPKHVPVRTIRPAKGWVRVNLRELWEQRELLYFFTWRDLKVRYKQTVLGVAWAVVQPVFLMVVFSVFFGGLAQIQTNGVPYPIFSYSALLPWTLFATSLMTGGTSITTNASVITKVYFPRIFLPLSVVLDALVDFAIASVVLIVLMLYYGMIPTLAIVLLPLFVLLAIVTSSGLALWFSALDARFRDIHYTIPFLTQLWLFATPVIYPASQIPANLQVIAALNPMYGVVEGFRWALLGQGFAFSLLSWISVLASVLIFVGGLFYFQRTERRLADVV